MEIWQRDLDRYLTTPPEDKMPVSKAYCHECGEEFYPEDRAYEIEDRLLCRDCAEEWLEDHSRKITEEECYGVG